MTKQELIERIQERTALQKNQIEGVLTSLTDVSTAALKAGDEVTIPGLGKLSVKAKAAKTGRNPKTGETIQIAARNAPAFTAAKALKDAVNQ